MDMPIERSEHFDAVDVLDGLERFRTLLENATSGCLRWDAYREEAVAEDDEVTIEVSMDSPILTSLEIEGDFANGGSYVAATLQYRLQRSKHEYAGDRNTWKLVYSIEVM